MLPETYLYDSASLVGLELMRVFSGTINMFFMPLALLFLGFVLYYFSGNKKHAEAFMPKFMGVGMRVVNYLWLLIGSITVFAGLYNVFFVLLAKILPDDNALIEPDTEVFVRGMFTLFIGLFVITTHYVINSKVNTKAELQDSVSKKVYITSGIVVFSMIAFGSLLSVSENILDNIYDETDYLSASALAVFFTSAILWGIYLWQGITTHKGEPQK